MSEACPGELESSTWFAYGTARGEPKKRCIHVRLRTKLVLQPDKTVQTKHVLSPPNPVSTLESGVARFRLFY